MTFCGKRYVEPKNFFGANFFTHFLFVLFKGRKYNLALVRLSYPVADPDTGLTILHGFEFSEDSVMPLCLPSGSKTKKNVNKKKIIR